MTKASNKTQEFFDRLIYQYLVRFLPDWVTPNFLSYFRIALVPIIYILLVQDKLIWAILVFVFAASTDFMDGTLARKKDLVTDLGKALDPIADKMLIATVLAYIGFDYLIVKVFMIVIGFEILAVLSSSLFATWLGKPIGANVFGKIKMVFQSFAVGIFMLGLILVNESIILISEYILAIALFFALLSGIEQVRRRIVINLNKLKTINTK